ncbi:hypothetical protein [Azospirillum palustre]
MFHASFQLCGSIAKGLFCFSQLGQRSDKKIFGSWFVDPG